MRRTFISKLALVAAVVVGAAGPSLAATITLTASTADFTPRAPGNTDGNTDASLVTMGELLNKSPARVGRGTSTLSELYVIPFQLPTLAPGESISSASFTVNVTGLNQVVNNPGAVNQQVLRADLYGLGYRTTSTVNATDAFIGSNGGATFDGTDATLLVENFLKGDVDVQTNPVISSTNPLVKTTSSADLIAYLNAQYAAGAVGGNWVFLRLNPDELYTAGQYEFATADNANAALRPVLTLETYVVPEPSALAAASCVIGSLVMRRRRA